MMGALAQPTRLKVVAELVRHAPEGLAVGEIATRVDTPQNTMSAHLAILSRAGLVAATREGRIVRYSFVQGSLPNLADFLVHGLPTGA